MSYNIQLIQGESNETLARLYARLHSQPGAPAATGLTLRGHVSGPFSGRAHTLPTTSPFSLVGEAEAAIAGDAPGLTALVPDPCYWSPRSPLRYRVVLSVCDEAGQEQAKITANLGLRMAGVRGSSFFFSGERWVLRGVAADASALAEFNDEGDEQTLVDELEAWREAKATLCLHFTGGRFPAALLEAASEQGVVVLAMIDDATPLETLAKVSQHAAVAFAAVKDSPAVDEQSLRRAAPNQVLLQWIEPVNEPAPWAEGFFLQAEDVAAAGEFAGNQTLPVVAFRNISATSLPAARAQCDTLQRDMAPWADCAGYVVWPR